MGLIKIKPKNISFEDRYNLYSAPDPNSGCWLWMGNITSNGYGDFKDKNRKQVLAHIASYKTFKGDTKGLCVLHKCDIRSCVNPDHLFLGTRKENIEDMDKKGRRVPPFGERNVNAKLTWIKAEAIREKLKNGQSSRSLAKEYTLNRSTVLDVKNNRTWKYENKPKIIQEF